LYPVHPDFALETKSHYSFNHYNAIPYEVFLKNPHLIAKFDILTTSKHNGHTFVSTIQSKPGEMLMFGTQWHPEKPEHECSHAQKIPRSNKVKKAGETIARNFVHIARTLSFGKRPSDAFFKKYGVSSLCLYTEEDVSRMEYDTPLSYYLLP
jgi:hypothetical protein